ncbi:vWA domain-containing protein, partial [Pelodictyon luteolum]
GEGYTHITVILDRSGSMDEIRDDTIGGFNAFIEEQKKGQGKATLTLVQFDTADPYEVIHSFRLIGDVPALTPETYVPRGGTPLLDALGRGINDIDRCVLALPEAERPGNIMVAVITDGEENSSREFRKEQIEKMIKAKTAGGWTFIFLSADLNAVHDAVRLGFHQESSIPFDKSPEGVSCCMQMLSEKVSGMRSEPKADMNERIREARKRL